MKNFTIFIFILSLIFISASNSNSQNTSKYTKPLCIMDLNFGYTVPMFDLGGSSLKDFYNFKGYSASGGFNANYTTKFSVYNFKAGQLRTYLTISYAQFDGSENRAYKFYDNFKPPWPVNFVPPGDTAGTSSITINSPFIAYGWETAFFTDRERKSVINAGMDFDVSVLFGKVYNRINGYREVYNNIVSNTRMGLGFNIGYSYRVANMLGLSLGTRLQISNLFGKSSEKVTSDSDLSLLDASDISLNSLLNSNRTIGFFGIYGGVSFYIGGSK